jgi:hypothetical protein
MASWHLHWFFKPVRFVKIKVLMESPRLRSRSLWDGAGLKKPIAPSRQFSYAPLFTSGERDFSSSQPLIGAHPGRVRATHSSNSSRFLF